MHCRKKQIRRVGGIKEIDVDVRVLAATNRDLLKMAEEKRFREDLYYRLNVLSIDIPPLRERRTDIPVLIDYFLKKHTRGTDRKITIDTDAKKLARRLSLSGQCSPARIGDRTSDPALRERHDHARRSAARNDTGSQRSELRPAAAMLFKLPPEGVNFEDVERSLIMQAMDRTDNNITKVAKLLGLTFRTLQYRLEKFGIKKDGDGDGTRRRGVIRLECRYQARRKSNLWPSEKEKRQCKVLRTHRLAEEHCSC